MNARRREIEGLRRDLAPEAPITVAERERWQDLPTFLEEQYYIPADDTPERQRLIVLEPHQRTILRHAFTKQPDGRYPYTTVIFSCPKKSGKTETASGVNLWAGLTWGSHLELYACANDYEQAQGRVFAGVARAIRMNPRLQSLCKITLNGITFPDQNTLTALAQDYAGAAGAQRLVLSTWDELWGYVSERSRRLYDELTPIPTLKNSLRFIVSYAGFEGESELLWELYERGVRKGEKVPPEELDGLDLPVFRNGSLLAYWDSLETAGEACRRMPWQQGSEGERYYAEQEQELRPNAFRRLHWNLWTRNEENFLDMDQWDACVDPSHRPLLPDKSVILDVGVDAAIKHDQASVVAVTYDEEQRQVVLARYRTFQPTPEDPLDLEESLEAFLRELARGYTLRSVYYDPYQFHRSATTLKKQGLPMVEFPQTSANLTAMGQNLYELIQHGNLRLYPDADLRTAAGQAVAIESPRGWRISKEKSIHKIDVLIGLAHAAFACVGSPEEPFFAAPRLAQGRVHALPLIRTVRFASEGFSRVRMVDDEEGPIRLYAEPVAHEFWRYGLGVVVVGPASSACLLDGDDRIVVAELHGTLSLDGLVEQVAGLSGLCGATVVPLLNTEGQAVLDRLKGIPGVRLYPRQERVDGSGPTRRRWGYLLNESTRETFYGELASWMGSEKGVQAPESFFDEMGRFGRIDGQLPATITRAHLRVAALAAAIQGYHAANHFEGLPHADPRDHPATLKRPPRWQIDPVEVTEEQVPRLIQEWSEGKEEIRCTPEQYWQWVRPALQAFARDRAEWNDLPRAVKAADALVWLDREYPLQ